MLSRNFGDLRDVIYKRQWKFRDDRGAFLVLHHVRKISIPTSFLDMALKAENPLPEIRTKNVVTNIWSCPSFAMYLSNKCEFRSIKQMLVALITSFRCSQ